MEDSVMVDGEILIHVTDMDIETMAGATTAGATMVGVTTVGDTEITATIDGTITAITVITDITTIMEIIAEEFEQ